MIANQWTTMMLETLADKVEHRDLKKGELLLELGEVCDYVGFLKEGSMRMYYINEEGQDISFFFYLAGDVFTNYEGVISHTPSNMILECLSPCQVSLIRRDDLLALYDSSMQWQKIGKQMADSIFLNAKKRIDFLLFLTPEQRYLELVQHQPELLNAIPQKYIASYIGVKPQSLSRIRKRIIS
ncbi:MAG: Crp/Fnr family transcriptional regulator [Flavobacteriaceae bacterium]|jgi:CRP-like cAMP-binding protein|nr:Crp/Fnr family transcriptional regulator [Flavobacteriaceae bacterium]